MSEDRRIEIVRYLDEGELDRLLDETDDLRITKRLTFVKRLYKRANLEDAADDVGKSLGTSLERRRTGTAHAGLGEPAGPEVRRRATRTTP